MTELRGRESFRSVDVVRGFIAFEQENVDLKPGDEILLMIEGAPGQNRQGYGVALRLDEKPIPEEDEVIVQYGEKQFVAQKIPDFI